MTELENNGFEPGFDGEAKIINTKIFRTSSLMSLCSENHIQPRSLTENKLLELGVGRDKFPIILPIIAEKILEYYGLQAWELRNDKRVTGAGMTPEHFQFITRQLSVEGSFNKFLRMNCGDRVDTNGEGTQYDKMVSQFGDVNTASQNVIKIEDKETNKVLKDRFKTDVERQQKELDQLLSIINNGTTLGTDQLKHKDDLEKSIAILNIKLKQIDEDNTGGNGSIE